MDIECGLVMRAGRKRDVDMSESGVEIFETRGPLRRNGEFGAQAERPAGAPAQNLVLIVERAGTLEQARLRPRKSAGAVDHPMIECITDAAAQRREIIVSFSDDRV